MRNFVLFMMLDNNIETDPSYFFCWFGGKDSQKYVLSSSQVSILTVYHFSGRFADSSCNRQAASYQAHTLAMLVSERKICFVLSAISRWIIRRSIEIRVYNLLFATAQRSSCWQEMIIRNVLFEWVPKNSMTSLPSTKLLPRARLWLNRLK